MLKQQNNSTHGGFKDSVNNIYFLKYILSDFDNKTVYFLQHVEVHGVCLR